MSSPNPPYVERLGGLQPELRHEPEVAIVGAGFHEWIARAANTRFLVLEVGAGHAGEVAAMLATLGYRDIRITEDLTHIERIVEGCR